MNKQYDNVIPFILPESQSSIEHVDSTTIVEYCPMTAEQRKLFEDTYWAALARAEGKENPDEAINDKETER